MILVYSVAKPYESEGIIGILGAIDIGLVITI